MRSAGYAAAMIARIGLALAFSGLAALGWKLARQQHTERVLDSHLHHLGNDATPDWKEAAAQPEGTRLDLRFHSGANRGEWLLVLDQRSIGKVWHLTINGAEIAQLLRIDGLVTRRYSVPPDAFKDGDNQLAIVPDDPADDIVVGNIHLFECSLRELYDLHPVSVHVVESTSNEPLPARVTFTDANGQRVPLYLGESATTAMRDGVIYTCNGEAHVELPPGEYRSYATRGAEWSLSEQHVTVAAGSTAKVGHALHREVDTQGFIAADTHMHTLTFSGHGDASVEERIVTLAGEGVELAIATDHNHDTDYRPYQNKLELDRYFTPVVGNEVTTEVGHFNGFPLDPKDAVPPHDLTDFVQIVDGIRAKGAKVVILNHPRWPDHQKGPFGVHHLDHATGARAPELKLTMDATEMINSTCAEPDAMSLFQDWFSLLNRGEHIFAVGSSDSHTVGDAVGQGRTYVVSATDDPSKIDVDACCDAIKHGHTSIGQGIFATVVVDGGYRMGDTEDRKGNDAPLHIELRVQAPSWIDPQRATVYIDGVAAAVQSITVTKGAPTDAHLSFDLPLEHPHDAWIVCVVMGGNVGGAYWPLLNPYTLAATNPVFIDRDGDGYRSPRETAAKWLETRTKPDEIRNALAHADDAVALHVLDLLQAQYSERFHDAGQARAEVAKLAAERAASSPAVAEFVGRE
jgi:hypothetical protein